ncbi:hypothetical protein [Methylorubrum thiocyanatum]|uniref:hypothetical protein n=1 Tax=Methylorubrum thiocyanatum TaxID=47958 RepID=UPI003F7ECF34
MQRRTSETRYDRFPAPFGKRINSLAVAFFIAVAAIAIGSVGALTQATDPAWSHQGGVAVWTDPQTGCRYTRSEAGMQPLVGPDGRPDCQRRPQ